MGIYIPSMEMPEETPVLFCVHPDGKVFADMEGGWKEYTAVPVPPHGDLIERDALIEALAKMVPWAIADPSANAFLDGLSAAYEAIKTAPTIIQADKEE